MKFWTLTGSPPGKALAKAALVASLALSLASSSASSLTPCSTGLSTGMIAWSSTEAARPSQNWARLRKALTEVGELRSPFWPSLPGEVGLPSWP